MIVLIDADTLIFRAASLYEEVFDFGDGHIASQTDPESAKRYIRKELNAIRRSASLVYQNIEQFIPVVSAFDGNYRRDLLPTYKAGRRKTHQPVMRKDLTTWVMEELDGACESRLEADDVISMLATSSPPSESLVVSIDKDLDTIPGQHHNPDKGTFYNISQEQAMKQFYRQALMGDPTDGFYGCPRVGIKTASKIIDGCWKDGESAVWQTILDTYALKGISPEDALTQARMAWLLVDGDYDYDTKEIHLWQPPVNREAN